MLYFICSFVNWNKFSTNQEAYHALQVTSHGKHFSNTLRNDSVLSWKYYILFFLILHWTVSPIRKLTLICISQSRSPHNGKYWLLNNTADNNQWIVSRYVSQIKTEILTNTTIYFTVTTNRNALSHHKSSRLSLKTVFRWSEVHYNKSRR